jgi:5-methylcytosine-specific restriction endonuclease McrA
MGFGKIKIDKQDQKFSELIRKRDGKCVFCGKSEGKLECSHFWGRGNKATRFDPLNSDTLCFHCHMVNEGNKQGFYRTWKIEQLGLEEYERLERRARSTARYGEYEKPVILNHLKEFGLDDFKGMAEKCFWHEVKDLL